MSFAKKADKENNVKGVRKARAAPDFSRLHKQWDAKLQKGKAVAKKPLTSIQPFGLTQTFQVDSNAKESIVNGTGITQSGSKSQRATISDVRRSSIKSGIPRASFRTQQRSSLYTKAIPNKQLRNDKATFSPNINGTYIGRSSVVVPKPSVITNSPSVKNAERLQGFHIDFKSDPDALNSIMNGTGIQLPDFPDKKLSSQFGRIRKNHANGRSVPFQKQKPNRLSAAPEVVSNVNPAHQQQQQQRWSIYSRESYSSKPDLMTWLKQLVTESKTANRNSLYTKSNKTLSSSDVPSSTTVVAKNTLSSLTNIGEVSQQSRFSKTVVGYQGDCVSSDQNIKPNNFDSSQFREEEMYKSPENVKKLSSLIHGSTVKSILKKNKKPAIAENQITKESKTSLKFITPSKSFEKKAQTPDMKTPIRLSVYARNQIALGLPLPKENCYERMGERITGESVAEHKTSLFSTYVSPSNGRVVDTPSIIKRVRWADSLKTDLETPSPLRQVSVNHLSTPDIQCKQANSLPEKFAASKTDVVPRKSPANFHQIKYVMPAEQPLEKTEVGDYITSKQNESVKIFSPKTEFVKPKQLTKVNDSWATILGRDNIQGGVSCNLSDKFNSSFLTLASNDVASVEPKKRKQKHRNSILERIYGDAITYEDDESPEPVICNASKKSTMGFGVRPFPEFGEPLVADLICFKSESDHEDASAVFAPNKDNINSGPLQSTMLNTPTQSNDEEISMLEGITPLNHSTTEAPDAPCKQLFLSASKRQNNDMLNCTISGGSTNETKDVPVNENDKKIFNCELVAETIVSSNEQTHYESSITNIYNTCSNMKLSQSTHCSTDRMKDTGIDMSTFSDALKDEFKQFFPEQKTASDIYEKTLSCSYVQTNITNSPVAVISENLYGPMSRSLKVCNILSPSMQMFPKHESTTFVTYSRSSSMSFGDQNGTSVLKPSTFRIPMSTSAGHINPTMSSESPIHRHVFGQMQLVTSMSMTNQNNHRCPGGFAVPPSMVNIKTNQFSANKSSAETDRNKKSVLKPSMLFSQKRTSDDVPTLSSQLDCTPQSDNRLIVPYQRDCISSFSKQSNHKLSFPDRADQISTFSSRSRQLFEKVDSEGNNESSINETSDESSVFEDDNDTDICRVFSKPDFVTKSVYHTFTPQTFPNTCVTTSGSQQAHQNSDSRNLPEQTSTLLGVSVSGSHTPSKIGAHGAFRHIPATCNIFPKVYTQIVRTELSTEMKDLHAIVSKLDQEQRYSSVLDAEISLYSKFAEISERFGKKVFSGRDGAKNILSELLTVGDDKHFVPLNDLVG